MLGMLTGRDWLAGLGLALSSVRPQVSLVLAFPFLFRRQHVWWWFVTGATGLAMLSMAIVGVQGIREFLQILVLNGRGEGFHVSESAMVHLIGLLRRIFPLLQPQVIRFIGWGSYLVTALGLCVVWAKSKAINGKHIGLVIIASLFTAPHLHYHDLILLTIPMVAAMLVLVRGGYIRALDASIALLTVSLAFLFGSLVPVLKYNLPYIVMILIVLITWFPEQVLFWKPRNVPL
jgi:hypothetical protein